MAKKKGYYAITGPEFKGIVRTAKEYNERVKGRKQTFGKNFTSEQEAQMWIDNFNSKPKKSNENTKFYAVYTPEFIGLVHSIKEYNRYIKNKKKAFGKGFSNEKDAKKWLKDFNQKKEHVIVETTHIHQTQVDIVPTAKNKHAIKQEVIMYIDGGFKEETGKFGIIAYAPRQKEPIYRNFGYVYDQQFNDLKNAGAELIACLRALEWAFSNEMKIVHILYDFQGIEDHIKNQPSHPATKRYQQMILRFQQHMQIHFLHICHGNKELHKEAHRLTQLTI